MTNEDRTLQEWLKENPSADAMMSGLLSGVLKGIEAFAPHLLLTKIPEQLFEELLLASKNMSDVLDKIFRFNDLIKNSSSDEKLS